MQNKRICLFVCIFLCVGLITKYTFATTYNLVQGWNLLGASEKIEVTEFNNSEIRTVWKWDRANKKWQVWSPNAEIRQLLEVVGLDLLNEIDPLEGFWINAKTPIELSLGGNGTVSLPKQVADSKIVAYAKLPEQSLDLSQISQLYYFTQKEATIENGFLIWTDTLKNILENEFGWDWDCDSDDAPDDEIPSDVEITFALDANGNMLAGVKGDDSHILFVLAYRHGYAYVDSNNKDKVWSAEVDSSLKSSLIFGMMCDLFYMKGFCIDKDNLNDYRNKYYDQGKFGLKNNFSQNIIRVNSEICHQQGDYGWYDNDRFEFDEMIRKMWSPAITRDANMRLGREFNLKYNNIKQGLVVVLGGNDNGNWSKAWLDDELILEQYDCGSILKIYSDKLPTHIKLENYTIWSLVHSRFWAAFVGDSVTASDYKEWCNDETNPANSYDQNPSPQIDVYKPGWNGDAF